MLLAYWPGSLTSLLYLSPPVYAEVSTDYYTRHPGIVSILMLTITYIQAIALIIHTQGRFNNHTVCSLYRILVMEPVSWVWWKWEILPRVGLEPSSLAFWASMLPCKVPDVTTIPMPPCLCSSLLPKSVQTTTIFTYAVFHYALDWVSFYAFALGLARSVHIHFWP